MKFLLFCDVSIMIEESFAWSRSDKERVVTERGISSRRAGSVTEGEVGAVFWMGCDAVMSGCPELPEGSGNSAMQPVKSRHRNMKNTKSFVGINTPL